MSPPTVTGLDEPVAVPDLSWVNFFNGRLLTGSDLAREQATGRIARRLLGRAVGAGVAHGLHVSLAASAGSATRPVLEVTDGLAVNRRGDALALAATTLVELAPPPAEDGASTDEGFATCVPVEGGTYTAATGIFMLAVGPASLPSGRAPVSGLGNESAQCNVAYAAEGVRFHLFRLALPEPVHQDPGLLRSRLAHMALGTSDVVRHSALVDPLNSTGLGYGLLDRLPPGCPGPDRVPLALLHWTAKGVQFVDRWAVRRRITAPSADAAFPIYTGDRRRAEAEAGLLQFQDQIEDLRVRLAKPHEAQVSSHFAYLPPAGLLPAATSGGPPGFDPGRFFRWQASSEIAQIGAGVVPSLLHDSLWHEPITVGTAARVQLYAIAEQEDAIADGAALRPVLVFASETLSYRGVARYGRATYGLSRMTPRVM
jgi:hypothetical protein